MRGMPKEWSHCGRGETPNGFSVPADMHVCHILERPYYVQRDIPFALTVNPKLWFFFFPPFPFFFFLLTRHLPLLIWHLVIVSGSVSVSGFCHVFFFTPPLPVPIFFFFRPPSGMESECCLGEWNGRELGGGGGWYEPVNICLGWMDISDRDEPPTRGGAPDRLDRRKALCLFVCDLFPFFPRILQANGRHFFFFLGWGLKEVVEGVRGVLEQEKSISSSCQLPNDALDCLASCAETEGVRGD